MDGEELSNLAEGLARNELLQYDYVLTGYIGTSAALFYIYSVTITGSESFLDSILSLLTRIEDQHSAVKYVPVNRFTSCYI